MELRTESPRCRRGKEDLCALLVFGEDRARLVDGWLLTLAQNADLAHRGLQCVSNFVGCAETPNIRPLRYQRGKGAKAERPFRRRPERQCRRGLATIVRHCAPTTAPNEYRGGRAGDLAKRLISARRSVKNRTTVC